MFPTDSTGVDARLMIKPDMAQAIEARFVAPVLEGRTPFIVARNVDDFGDHEEFVSSENVVLALKFDNQLRVLIETAHWAALLTKWPYGRGQIAVRAETLATAEEALESLLERLPPKEPAQDTVHIDFWQLGSEMFTTQRSIDAPTWPTIASYYPPEIALDLLDLMAHKLDSANGRVVLWHGPPGTGKTTAIRALAGAWREQARFQIVLDPEAVFTSSSHMMSIILGNADDSEEWRVLVLEDADNLVAKEGHDTQVLSRLLNVGDGIVGQGLRVLVLLTTNKPPAQLHPALTRPGRCLAHTEFRRFTRKEAVDSFGPDVPDRAELTLAELLNRYEVPSDAVSAGLYL